MQTSCDKILNSNLACEKIEDIHVEMLTLLVVCNQVSIWALISNSEPIVASFVVATKGWRRNVEPLLSCLVDTVCAPNVAWCDRVSKFLSWKKTWRAFSLRRLVCAKVNKSGGSVQNAGR